MGWTIQHIAGRTTNRGYSATADAVRLALKHAPARHNGGLQTLLDKISRGGESVIVLDPRQAAAIADGIAAAKWPRLAGRETRDLIHLARQIGDAAETAARTGRPWRWS